MKEREKIVTSAVSIPPPYISQAVRYGNLLFVSGQCGMDPHDHVVSESIGGQVEQALKNLKAILNSAGSGMDKILMCQCFLKDLKDFEIMNSVYQNYFSNLDIPPARYTVLCGIAHPDLLFEIAVIAATD